MIKLVEIYKKNSIAKTNYGHEQSIDEGRYHLREVYCNKEMISTMRVWAPPKGSLMPADLDSRQSFTSVEMGGSSAYKTIIIVKDVKRLSEEIQDTVF